MLIIDGTPYPVIDEDGTKLVSTDYHQQTKLTLHSRGRRPRRTSWVRGITLHTRMGKSPIQISEESKDRRWDELLTGRWARSGRMVGAHIAVDSDGSFACLADIQKTTTYHAGQVNDFSVGIEMYQDADGTIYDATLHATVAICDTLTRILGIQRQFVSESKHMRRFARPTKGTSRHTRLAYMKHGREGRDFVGIYGHRNTTRNRGPGDPGDEIFLRLEKAGYERFSVKEDEDRDAWVMRQRDLDIHDDDVDGIPGPMTREALVCAGYPHGLWIPRPNDGDPLMYASDWVGR